MQIQQGIPQEKAKEVVRFIKDSKAKVQASIQGDIVRVSGKDRDTLQGVIAELKAKISGSTCSFPIIERTEYVSGVAGSQ